MQLLRNVYLVSGFAYGLHPNAYLVKGQNANVMIDTGLDENDLAVIDATMRDWGLDQAPVSHLLITHAHFDHCGNAHALRQRGAVTVAGPSDAEGIERGDDRTIPYAYGRKFPACPVDVKVKDGDTVEAAGLCFDVIHVPGHSSGCVFYRLVLDGRIILFTGDVVRVGTNCESAKLGWSGGVDYDRKAYMQSLQRIAKLEADVILAGHFQPCLRDGYKVLQNAYMRALLDWRQPATYE
jgi:glyoxylase-like metal-dependent hydrolase (beta-lactamase superfamily II)